uniref:Uncharacterized protein n=1 Tax=Glossina pallidipes TaxID=7398 RepID=A0A1A9ZTX5_GLOPL
MHTNININLDLKDLETNNIVVMTREFSAPLQRRGFSAISSKSVHTQPSKMCSTGQCGHVCMYDNLPLDLTGCNNRINIGAALRVMNGLLLNTNECKYFLITNDESIQSQTQLTGSQASNGNDSKLFLKATTPPCCI